MKIVTFAETQKVKSSFEFKNLISSTRNCNEFRFFEPHFTSLEKIHSVGTVSNAKTSFSTRLSIALLQEQFTVETMLNVSTAVSVLKKV